MQIIVSKFGGSSTASADRFRRILDIVRSSPGRRCVVLSAPGIDEAHGEKVTSLLEDCWSHRGDRAELRRRIERVETRFAEIASGLHLPLFMPQVQRELAEALAVSRAHTLSRGEYLAALLFSLWSGFPMVDASKLIAFRWDGVADESETLRRLCALDLTHGPVVVPGFYGADPDGRVCLFPRNGSDITGALAASGLGAALYENWTDVPGLMTADPALVPEARLIPQVSYRQMRMLSRAGAQVLHPACLDPVASTGIPTRLRCTQTPSQFGTLIDDGVQGLAPCVVGVRACGQAFDGVEAACVSVFGLPAARILEAARPFLPLDTAPGRECTRLFFPEGRYEACLAALHRRLIET